MNRISSGEHQADPVLAVLIPCHNEETTIRKVVSEFKAVLPNVPVYVYDNASTDRTAEEASAGGAVVRTELRLGKGHAVRRMFRDIDADFFIVVDGDDTYEASLAPKMIELAVGGPFDLVNCVRLSEKPSTQRAGHRLGNRLLTACVRAIFGGGIKDMLSGYKVFSRRFVKSFPALATGFDIETEIAIHALELAVPVAHIEGPYRKRPQGSESKLRTYGDGWRIVMLILKLARHERPMFFFNVPAAIAAASALLLAWPLLITFLETGLVPRVPTAILATGLALLAALSAMTGIVLDTVSRGRREMRLLAYLQASSTAWATSPGTHD